MKNSKMKKIFAGISGLCVMASALPAFPAVNAATESADFVAGDANCSGQVDIADAVAIMAYVTNSTAAPLSGQALDNADVYQRGDGVGITDAVSVQKYLTKLISSLPESYNEVIEPVTSVNYIHLKNTAIETEGENMVVEGTKVTISASGEYYVDGTLDDGQIIVNVPDETVDAETVKIFLNGVSITGTAAPAIYVENAENTSINLMDGTTNTLSDGTVAYSGDYLDTGVIEAKDDLTIKGTGTLNITANTQYAIQCNNDIKFTDGIVNIETILDDAVRGKTSVTVKELAVLNIDSECDGIKSTQGNVAIEGGTISVKAGNDAIQAETTIDISGGTVVAGGDRGLTGVTGVNITGGSVIATATDNQTDTTLLNATQGTMLLNCIADATNTEDGCWKKANTIVVNGTTYAPNKKYMYVLISDASIASGQTYNLTNGSTGATVSHTNNTATSFTTTGTITAFETVDMNPSGSVDVPVTPADGYTITLGNTVSTNAPETVATVSNNVVTIIQPAVFSVSGTASEGQIVVDVDKTAYADGVVELDLMGANLTSTTSSPIYVAQIGDEVQIVAKSGYDNVISDGSSYTNADGGMGAIYSCDDLKIKGSGNLTVNGNAGDGIVSKNDLKVYNGNITVNAADDCIRGKDSVTVGDIDDTDFSTLILNLKSTAGDGIKSNCQDASTADKTYGLVDVNGGTINMNVYGDGIQAAQVLNVNGGTLDIETTGSKDSGSAKGLKGGLTDDTTGTTTTGIVNVNGGDIVLKTNDDGINSNGDINMLGGETQITVKGTTSGYQGLHADTTVNLGSDGNANVYDDMRLVIYQAYEGIEAYNIYQKSGSTVVTSTDDAYNVAGGADNSGSSGQWPGQGGTSSGGAGVLSISGGFSIISVANGDHDGYDSNGSLSITGGIAITNGQDAFDCDGGMSYTGGVYVKNIGSQMGGMGGMGGGSSMTESVNVSCSLSGGERVTLCDGSGNVIVSFINDKSASSLVAGCTAYSGATFYTGGTLNGSTYFQELDQSQLAAYGGTLSGGTAVSGSGSGSTNPWG